MHCLQQEFTCTQVPRPTPHFLSQPLFEEHSGRQQLRAPKRSRAAGEGAGVARLTVGQELAAGVKRADAGAGAAKAAVPVKASRSRQRGMIFFMSVSFKTGRDQPALPSKVPPGNGPEPATYTSR